MQTTGLVIDPTHTLPCTVSIKAFRIVRQLQSSRISKKMTDQNVLDFGMAIFYWHLSNRRGKLSRLELLGLANQLIFHASAVYEFRGLSQKVSAAFVAAIGGGAGCQYLTQ